MGVNIDKYRITATPRFRTVTPKALLTYYCSQRQTTISRADAPQDECQWYCYNDRAKAKERGVRYIVPGPRGFIWKDARWTFTGRHTIKSLVKFAGTNTKVYYEYPQWVDTEEAVLGALLKKRKTASLPDPFKEYSIVGRYIKLLNDGAKKYPVTDRSKKEKHDKRVRELTHYKDKLGERLSGLWGKRTAPVNAVHLEVSTQKRTRLRVQVVRKSKSGSSETWCVVDWTVPTQRYLTGVYEGTGNSAKAAIKAALGKWDSANRYPNGRVRYSVSGKAAGHVISGSFETDGASFWDSVSSFFSYVAMGAGVVAGIVTLVAPVPGSRVVSAAIWTSILSSSAAAVINIGQRYDEGFNNWKDDAFDGLTIVGNIFTGGWMRCANVVVKTSRTAKAAKFALIGSIGTDGGQGILIAIDHVQKYEKIMNDKTLAPEERSQKLMELFRSMGLNGLMMYVSFKATKTDLKNLKAGKIDTSKIKKLKDPNQTVDLTKTPKIKSTTRTKKRRVKATVQDEQIRQTARAARKAAKAGESVFPDALPASRRGMRNRDHKAFSRFSQKTGDIIIVRNSNPDALQYIGKKGYKPKPMEVKAKTRKTPPSKGLAAAVPNEPDPETYKKIMKSIKSRGLKVDGPPAYVVRDKHGNAFYSDYDLHGIYSAQTGKNTYSEGKRLQLNNRLGKKHQLIQHGPHDRWKLRNDPAMAGPNRGPQPPCTAYLPDGRAVHLETVADMKAFYKQHRIDWKSIYPND